MAQGAKTIQAETVAKAKGKRGQPTKFTPELWREIIDRVACCENILDICSEPHMPSYMTVRGWYRADPALKAEMEKAWEDAAYLMHYVNDSMLAGGTMSTQDFRRDEARAANNRWFMGKTFRRVFGDKQTVDLNSTVQIAVPSWVQPIPQLEQGSTPVLEGEVLDPDEVYERETVARIMQQMQSEKPTDAQDDSKSDV
jgi:hypothetical protein